MRKSTVHRTADQQGSVFFFDRGGERCHRPVEKLGHALPDLIAVAVDRLFAHQHYVGLLGIHDGSQRIGYEAPVELVVRRVDTDGAIGAGGEGGAQGLLDLFGTDSDHDDLAQALLRRLAVLGQAQRCFERVLVEGVRLPFEAGGVDGGTASRDLHLVGVVRVCDALQRY
jgi:hypothetical protein